MAAAIMMMMVLLELLLRFHFRVFAVVILPGLVQYPHDPRVLQHSFQATTE
jgi:hypothetical protein